MNKKELIIKKLVNEAKEEKEILNVFTIFFETYIKQKITKINDNKDRITIFVNFLDDIKNLTEKENKLYYSFFDTKIELKKIILLAELLKDLEHIRKKENKNEKDFYKEVFEILLNNINNKDKYKNEIDYIYNLINEVIEYQKNNITIFDEYKKNLMIEVLKKG